MLRLPWWKAPAHADAATDSTERRPIVIVSGLPRSGTSMMMQVLRAGGCPVLSDGKRAADRDNPRGYLEFERVKTIQHDKSWLAQAQGKALKVISALLFHLPPQYDYTIIFVRRDMAEVLASQGEMLRRRGVPRGSHSEGSLLSGGDAKFAALFQTHLVRVTSWLAQQPHMHVLYVDYHKVLAEPRAELARVREFLRQDLILDAMVSAVDPTLYRQRAQ